MSFSDSDLLPLSALQHYIYCPRQCALIHLEQQWTENRFTAEGRAQHDRVDRPEHETRDGIRYEYAVLLRSLRLGLIGKADVVEFHDDKVFPVEHKRGRPKPTHCDLVQLCAQALCLEEILGVKIPDGAVFYGQPRRRQAVAFTPQLRSETEQATAALHEMLRSGKTPPAEYDKKKCNACSLLETCMPKKRRAVSDYLQEALREKAP
ncbi:CRISPR-associated protein Cas4 [Tichowtungia aerotolerans]|uniref:CRISPR-associated exonuclease Cas4 n=1 Tax=Tichowtungia aerotolerans TaxID=2697043 RepID=A0A6P1M757_9BACT|nr:CRISPR-associated protein Cas4 [Tichowtungia aerotolerans]QHI69687.1 CRISPR-associated protein Cas4 [Tichowtungia aerotolerans]